MKSSEPPGRRARPRPDRGRPDHRRTALAAEAARIIQEEGLTDYRGAKAKAAGRLRLGRGAPLPTNEEIAAALSERNRLFQGDSQPLLLEGLRHAAAALMAALAEFHPRLTGDVLSGHATAHSAVDLHVFSDTVESVGWRLTELGIVWRSIERRHRLRRETGETFPGLRFMAEDCEFVLSVFPLRLRGHPPLSPLDGRPMQRASLRELRALLAAVDTPGAPDTGTGD